MGWNTVEKVSEVPVLQDIKTGDFFYFDPPYHPVSSTASFTSYTVNSFRAQDQKDLAAVFARLATGSGQHIDLSQQEALASVGRQELSFYLCEGTPHTRQKGRKRRGGILYRCKNGYVCIWAGPFLKALVEMIGSPDWANTELFQNPTLLSDYMDEFNRLVETWTMEHTAEEINQIAVAHGVPCSPVRTVDELVNDEQLAFRDFFIEMDHSVAGRLKYPGAPYKLSATPWKMERPAPLLGEHNERVYCQMLGYNRQDLVRIVKTHDTAGILPERNVGRRRLRIVGAEKSVEEVVRICVSTQPPEHAHVVQTVSNLIEISPPFMSDYLGLDAHSSEIGLDQFRCLNRVRHIGP
jgi:hypothetical protein